MSEYTLKWKDRRYTLSEIKRVALLQTGELIAVEWQGLNPHADQRNFIYFFNLDPAINLSEVTKGLGIAAAHLQSGPKIFGCPNSDHKNQTGNFCSICGLRTLPIKEIHMKVMGYETCPTCGIGLNHAHYESCRNCGQNLKWVCRDGK